MKSLVLLILLMSCIGKSFSVTSRCSTNHGIGTSYTTYGTPNRIEKIEITSYAAHNYFEEIQDGLYEDANVDADLCYKDSEWHCIVVTWLEAYIPKNIQKNKVQAWKNYGLKYVSNGLKKITILGKEYEVFNIEVTSIKENKKINNIIYHQNRGILSFVFDNNIYIVNREFGIFSEEFNQCILPPLEIPGVTKKIMPKWIKRESLGVESKQITMKPKKPE